MEELKEVLENVTKSTQAAAEEANAVQKVLEKKGEGSTDWSKLLAKPSVLEHKNQEGEIKAFRVVLGLCSY